jgi:hypothetical protein
MYHRVAPVKRKKKFLEHYLLRKTVSIISDTINFIVVRYLHNNGLRLVLFI